MMSVEQVARDFIMAMNDVEKMKGSITADAIASGGVMPQPIPAKDALNMMTGFNKAFPDLKFDIESVTVNGNQATVKAKWGGTQTGTFDMGIPGMPSHPADREKGIG